MVYIYTDNILCNAVKDPFLFFQAPTIICHPVYLFFGHTTEHVRS